MNKALTLEHIYPGIFPDWLFQHLCSQTLNPDENTYLIVHSSDAARTEIIERLEGEKIGPIDRSRHHTLQSLRISLHADLRLPRLLSSDASGARLLHAECQLGAKAGDFPALHPSPEWRWGEGRTRALARLCQVFDTEDVRRWDGPGIHGFRSRLTRMGSALNGTHPLLQHRTLINALESKEEAPFMLVGVIGIIVMDQPPTLSQSDRRILQSLRRFRPIHQLCQHGDATIGNHRLGLHGAILEDVIPCTEDTLPDWLPVHSTWTPTAVEQEIHRLLVPRRGLAIEASLEVLRDWLQEAPPDADVLIIDPTWQERTSAWTRGLTEVGLRPPRQSRTINSTPVIHWLGELVSIGMGPDAWSMERLRGLGTQKSLTFDEEWSMSAPHPVHDDWSPMMDSERIESLGRIWHIMGGHGALGRWLQAFSSQPHPAPWETEEEAAIRAECTQWWFLTLLARLSPLLSSGERTLLSDEKFHVGCATGAILPLPEISSTGDEWLTSLTKHINWERLLEDAGALQRLLEGYTTLRRSQSILDHRPAISGSRWVEDLLGLLEDVNVPTVVEASDRVRLLTPEDALGTSADLILLTHLTSTQWNLSTERLPWMNEEERTRLNLNRPDSPLRHARHVLHHLLHASQQTILIDATGLDEDAQPAAPLSEWFAYRSGANSPDDVLRPSFMSDDSRWETASSNRTRGHHLSWRPSRIEIIRESDQSRVETFLSGRGQRNRRQQSGLELHASRSPDSPPLNPDSVSIPLDSHVMQDRLRRQPTDGDGSDSYLRAEHHDRFIAPGNLRIVPTKSGAGGLTKPRNADSWPVLGGIFDNKHLLATDPRPFSPSLTELPVFDSRHGQSEDTAFPRQIWSASRLKKWQDCPRQGWLERRLGAGQLEYLKEDLDARIRGNLIHGALGAVFEHALGIPEHTERPSKGAKQLHKLGKDPQELFVYILDYLAQHAPWLEREDATATLRRHDLIGLSRNEWLDWLASPKPILPTGRLGRMLLAELELYNTLPIAMEWSLDGIEIPHPDGRSIRMNGYIDRVDVFLPFEILKNSTGSSNQRHEMNKKFYEYRLEEWKLQKEEFETYKKLLQRFLDVEKKLTDQMLEEAHLTRKEFDEKSSVKYYERKSTVQGEISEILTDTGSIVVDGDLIIKISTSGGVKNIYFNKEIAEVIDILIDVGQSVNKGDVLIKSDHLLARLKDRAPHLPLDDLKILRLVIDELQGYIPKGQHHITLESGHTWIIRQYHPSEEHAGDHFPVTIYSPEMEGFLPGENLKESIDEFEAIERKYQKLVRDGFAPYFDPEYECAELEKLRPPVVFDPGPKPQEPIVDEKLPLTIAPLDWSTSSEWVPERLIVIRDIKSIDGPKKEKRGERHRKALYDELQLALYARAWEIAHPGDLVIGVGISEIGENTEHRLEVSLPYLKLLEDNGMGKVTNFTHSTHRLPSEGPSPSSDAFRAWMQERLSTAINVATAANEGRVIATPSEETCRWCDVKQACGLAPIVGGDRSWN